MNEILLYLKNHGELFDTEIAKAIGIPLAEVRLKVTELARQGEVITCNSIKYKKGEKLEGISCRLAGHIPKAAPGRKPKVQLRLS